MGRLLCISITFLAKSYHGKEWPPYPRRLFQALVSAARIGKPNSKWSREKAALEWLESRNPPEVVAAKTEKGKKYTTFVFGNELDDAMEMWAKEKKVSGETCDIARILQWKRDERAITDHLHKKVLQPWFIRKKKGQGNEEPHVRYLWKIDDQEWEKSVKHVEAVRKLANSLTMLGHGMDAVIGHGSIIEESQVDFKGTWYVPDETDEMLGNRYFETPMKGSLKSVIDRWENRKKMIDLRERIVYALPKPIFDRKLYRDLSVMAGPLRNFTAFLVEDLKGELVSYRGENIAKHASWLKRKFTEFFKKSPSELKTILFIPLPTIGRFADGKIRRIMIAQQPGKRIPTEYGRLSGEVFQDEKGKSRLRRITDRDNVLSCYISKSDKWMSVTPLLVRGLREEKFEKEKIENYILEALANSGYPPRSIRKVWYQKSPLWKGSLHVQEYNMPRDLAKNRSYHIGIRFQRPVKGPVLAGLGNDLGFGVFASPETYNKVI